MIEDIADIVDVKYNDDKEEEKPHVKLSEWFYTIQGEGPSVGTPAVFFRFGYCNLQCSWCDSKYTWDAKNFNLKDEIKEIPVSQLRDWWERFGFDAGIHPKNVIIVLTGGEPLMPMHVEGQVALLRALNWNRVEVETAGTYIPDSKIDKWVKQYNVSPKLKNSGNAVDKRYVRSALCWFSQSKKAIFKFVVEDDADLMQIKHDFSELPGMRPHMIYLMPQGINEAQLKERRQEIAEICKTEGYNYTDRLHITIWGPKRGV